MSIALRSRQMFILFLFLLALVTVFVLSSILLNAVVHINVWQIILPKISMASGGS